MTSGPITSWGIDEETVETVSEFIFLGSKITADGDCSHEIKRRLLLGRKVMTNLDSILKSRDITLPTKVCLVKAMVFPVVTYGCERWTVKKAEHWRIDAFELWCWRRLLKVPWTERRSNQSTLNEISPGCSLEGLMLKLKLQYFVHLMQRVDSLEKTLMQGGIGGRRRRGRQRMRWLNASLTQWTWVWLNSGSWWWTGRPGVLRFLRLQGVGHDWATELNWTELMCGSHSVVSETLLPLDYSPPGSSVHEILQARILEWVAIPFSRGSSWFRNWIQVSYTAGRFLTVCDTREDTINPAMLYLKAVLEIIQ